MKKVTCPTIFFILFSILNLSAHSPSKTIKFRLVNSQLIIIPVQISKSETLDFLLDTGTNTSVITPDVAVRLNLRPIDRIEMITVTGTAITPRSFLPSLTIGGKSVTNVEVLWSELSELRRLDNRISGILGQNILSRFDFILDLGKKQMIFATLDEGRFKNAVRLPFETDDGRILLNLQINQKNFKFVFDSAAGGLVLFASGCRKLKNQLQLNNQPTEILTSTGRGLTGTSWLNELRLGHVILSSLPIILLNKIERTEDGLLPTLLFQIVYFNNSEKYVILIPHPDKADSSVNPP